MNAVMAPIGKEDDDAFRLPLQTRNQGQKQPKCHLLNTSCKMTKHQFTNFYASSKITPPHP